MRPLEQIFAPFFFAVTGAAVDLGALLVPAVGALAHRAWPRSAWSQSSPRASPHEGSDAGTPSTVGVGMVPRRGGRHRRREPRARGRIAARTCSAPSSWPSCCTTVVAPVMLQRTIPRALAEAKGHRHEYRSRPCRATDVRRDVRRSLGDRPVAGPPGRRPARHRATGRDPTVDPCDRRRRRR